MLDVDEFGLDDMDARILKTIIEKFDGGPVGVNTIAAAIGEDASTIEEVYEPFLVQHGFLQRTPRGRVATPQAYRHFGFTPPALPHRAGRAVLSGRAASGPRTASRCRLAVSLHPCRTASSPPTTTSTFRPS